MLMAQLLLLSSVAFGGDKSASSELARKSIVSRSSSGLAQVSNLGTSRLHAKSGGGFGPDPEREWVEFDVHIPLDSAERDAEVRKYLAKIEKSMPLEQITEEVHQRALERTREFVYQHRVGRFQVECRILDGDRVMAVGIVELEVLFKGRFSDVGLPASPPV
jgi:hypothetical protein